MQNYKTKFEIEKIVLFLILVILPVYLVFSLYFLDKEYFICPLKYERDIVVRCDKRGNGFFGAERSGSRLHEGLDLLAEVGIPVLASRTGKVVVARYNRGMGNYIVIRHPGDIRTIYGHLLKICVTENQFVRQGQIIGRVGKTGNANYRDIQPHLHFEIKKARIPQNPLEYLE